MIERYRDLRILEQIEKDLKAYIETKDSESVLWMIDTANHQGCLHYELSTIDPIITLFHHIHGAAIAIYDDMFPLYGEEASRISRARRKAIKEMGFYF